MDAPGGTGKLVLVVDDDRVMLKLVEKVLAAAGHEVACAESERLAMTAFRARVPDVVITDLNMVGRSGLDVLREVRELQPGVPVILLSGKSELKDVVAALRDGAFDYLLKPFEPDQLAQLVGRALSVSVRREHRGKVAVVLDPDLLELGITRAALTDLGYEVLDAARIADAQQLVRERHVDLLVTEIELGGRPTTELIADVREHCPEVACIVMATRATTEQAIACMRAGALDLLVKPVPERQLSERVARAQEWRAQRLRQRKR